MNKSELDSKLQEALLNYKKILVEIKALEKMAEETHSSADESALAAATIALEDCTVRHALNEATLKELELCKHAVISEEKTYQAAKQAQKENETKLAGLQRRIESTRQGVEDKKEKLLKAEIEWLSYQIQQAEESYSAAAEKLKLSYHRIMACSKALADRGNSASPSIIYSGEISIPAIGIDCMMKAMPGENRVGGFYFKEQRPVFHFGILDIESELACAATTNKVSRGGTIKKIIESLSSEK